MSFAKIKLFLKTGTICTINYIRSFNCGLIAILSLHNYRNVTIAMTNKLTRVGPIFYAQ